MTNQKRCPYCAEEIRVEAIKCRHCGSRLDMAPTETAPWLRRPDDGMLAGVCAGLAERFEISVTVVRLAFVLAFLLGFGTALVLYVVLWIVMPQDDQPFTSERSFELEHTPYDSVE